MPRRLLTSSWPAVFVAVIGITIVLVRFDVPPASLLRYAAYLIGCVAFHGVVAWRLLLARLHVDEESAPTWFEDLSLGTIFGFGLQLPVFLFGVAVGMPLIVLGLPIAALLVLATRAGRAAVTMPTRRLDVRASWALSVVIVYGVAWLGYNVFARRSVSIPANQTRHIDEAFHQALIADIANRFPPEIPFLLGTRLDYHWFTHAQIAATNAVSGVESVLLLRALMPSVALSLAVLGLGAVALRLTGRPVAAAIAPALLVAGVFHGPDINPRAFLEPYLSARFVSSPTHAYSVMMSMPAVMLTLEVLRPRVTARRSTWVALGLALLMLSGSKATFLLVFVCGAIAVWLLQLVVRRRVDRTASGLVLLMIAVAVFAQLVIFGGQSGAMELAPFETVDKALGRQGIDRTLTSQVAMTLAILVSWLLYGAGAVGLLRHRRWLDPRAVWMLVAIAAGITVPFVFFRQGLSQLWFSRGVAELVVLVSVWGLACLLPKPLTARHASALGVVVTGAGLGAYLVSTAVGDITPGNKATVGSLLLTVLAPFVAAGLLFLVSWAVRGQQARRLAVVLPVVFLMGLGTLNVAAFGNELVTAPARNRNPPETPLFAAGGVAAAVHIREHSTPDAVVATNVHCVRPWGAEPKDRACDVRNFWISAYTQRRVLVEGWGYTVPGREAFPAIPYPERFEANEAAFQQPSPATVGRLVDTYGVSWLFVSKKYPADIPGLRALDGLLTLSYENAHYLVFRVQD